MSEGTAHDPGTPQIIGDMLELWPGEWVKASAIATVAALPPPLVTPVAVGGPSGTVDITEEVERRSPPAQPAASPASMSLPGGSGPEPGCRIHLVGETGAKRCAYPVAVVLQALATIREGVR